MISPHLKKIWGKKPLYLLSDTSTSGFITSAIPDNTSPILTIFLSWTLKVSYPNNY